jgi:hypothetical protein
VLEGDVGLGYLEVRHNEYDDDDDGPPWDRRNRSISRDERNAACATQS